MREIAEAAWRCADPGVQYDTTINHWHTCPESGRINASNPCSEYMHVDDSACNLASLNLMKFRRADGTLDVESFEHAVDIMLLAQEIIVGPSSYPTEEIGVNARAFRQLGLGYANLGAYLMSNGMPYDSDEGRGAAAAITALMTGRAYRRSAEVAGALGPYERYETTASRTTRDADAPRRPYAIPGGTCADGELLAAARRSWDEAVELGEQLGYRNAQATVLAPTGTISFLMDCDTTGVEPDFSLVKFKELVGGGQMTIVNRTVPLALQTLGYSEPADRADRGAPRRARHDRRRARPRRRAPAGVRRRRRRARDLAHGPHQDDGRGAAVHLGRDLEDRQPAAGGDGRGHRRRLHPGVAAGHQGARDLPRRLEDRAGAAHRRPTAAPVDVDERVEQAVAKAVAEAGPRRKRMPRERQSITHKFSIGGHEGYITAGMYEDGTVGEIFLTDIGKEGSTLRGMMNSFATAISIALQYGVPLETLVQKFSYMRFEPEGITGNPEIPFAKSMPDYIMRWLASRFLDTDAQEELGILTPEVRARKAAQDALAYGGDTAGPPATAAEPVAAAAASAPPAGQVGDGGRAAAPTSAADRHAPGRPGDDAGPRPRPGVQPVRRHDAADGVVLHVLQLRQQHRLRLTRDSRRLTASSLAHVRSTLRSLRPCQAWLSRVRGALHPGCG